MQFTIFLHYPPLRAAEGSEIQPTSFTAILRGTILSVKSPQVRYVIRGTNGTYSKFGADVQEAQLQAIAAPSDIFSMDDYGQEPEDSFGTLENLSGGQIVRSM